jgi:hypothetical protein
MEVEGHTQGPGSVSLVFVFKSVSAYGTAYMYLPLEVYRKYLHEIVYIHSVWTIYQATWFVSQMRPTYVDGIVVLL